VGKGSGKSDEAEESNSWRGNRPANMTKSDGEPVTGGRLLQIDRHWKVVYLYQSAVHPKLLKTDFD